MANYAELIGEQIHFYERNLVDTKSISEVLEMYQPTTGWISPRLPESCVFVGSRLNYTIYAVEREPRFVTIHPGYGLDNFLPQFATPKRTPDDKMYYIAPVPWEYYLMAISDKKLPGGFGQEIHQASGLSLFWSMTRVTDLDQATLFPAPLPNVGSGGSVCLGDNSSEYQIPHEKMIDTVFNFYESYFNGDLGMGTGLCSNMEEWLTYADEYSEVNLDSPEFIMPRTDGLTMAELMKKQNDSIVLADPDRRFSNSNKGFLERLIVTLPEQDSSRLMHILRTMVPEAENTENAV